MMGRKKDLIKKNEIVQDWMNCTDSPSTHAIQRQSSFEATLNLPNPILAMHHN